MLVAVEHVQALGAHEGEKLREGGGRVYTILEELREEGRGG